MRRWWRVAAIARERVSSKPHRSTWSISRQITMATLGVRDTNRSTNCYGRCRARRRHVCTASASVRCARPIRGTSSQHPTTFPPTMSPRSPVGSSVSIAPVRTDRGRPMCSPASPPNQDGVAPDFAARFGREVQPFKRDVRKLKELGLTISLLVGYELSPTRQGVSPRRRQVGQSSPPESPSPAASRPRAARSDRGAVAATRLAGRALDRTRHADRGDDRAAPSRTGAHTDATPASRSSTLSTHPGSDGAAIARSTRPAEPAVERQRRRRRPRSCAARAATRATRRRRRRSPSRTYSCTLSPGVVAQLRRARACQLRQREALSSAARPSVASPNPRANRPSPSRRTRLVHLERDGEPVGRRPRQAGGSDQLAEAASDPSASASSTATALSSTPTPLTMLPQRRD